MKIRPLAGSFVFSVVFQTIWTIWAAKTGIPIHSFWLFSFSLLIIVALNFFVFMRWYRSVKRSLTSIHDGVAHWQSGYFNHSIYLTRDALFAELAHELNMLARNFDNKTHLLQNQKKALTAILDGMKEPVIVLDKGLIVQQMNTAAGVLIGMPSAQAVGKMLLDVYRNTQLYDFACKTLKLGTLQEDEIRITDLTGSGKISIKMHPTLKILQAYAVCLRDEYEHEESSIRVVIVLNDVSRLKMLEEIRKDFVVNVSLEMKTPINRILESLNQLFDSNLGDDETKTQHLTLAREQSEHLNAIVEDLISLSRLEQNDVGLKKATVHVHGLAERVINDCRLLAESRNTLILNEVPEGAQLNGEADLVYKALFHLVENALKYGPKDSSVKIRYGQSASADRIVVKDYGVGIPEKYRPRIFERFFRMDENDGRKQKGTGLGLAIVKHIMLAHKGDIYLKCRKASNRFILIFPQKTDI